MPISLTTFWLIFALALAGLEMLSGTFYLLAIAMGVASGALAAWLGLTLSTQTAVVAIVGVIAVILLHRWRKTHLPPPEANASMEIGQQVHIIEWKDARHARVQYRGSQWDSELSADADTGHSDYFIVAVRGSTLIIQPTPPEQN